MSKNGVLLMLAAALLAAVSQILLKKSAQKEHKSWIFEYLNVYVVSGYVLLAGSLFLNVWAYQEIEYRYGQAINAVSYVFVLFLSRLFLGEKITPKKLIGNLVIIVGILVAIL